jgi:hypothetical protein
MADTRTSLLTALAGAEAAADDVLPIVDTSASSLKKITIPALREATGIDADLAASSGSSLVGFIQSGTGAVARTAQDKARDVVSVKDFGAVGDGVTDDTAAIRLAYTAVAATQGSIHFPRGTYKYTDELIPPLGVTWVGVGPTYGCVLYADGPLASIKMVGAVSGSGGYCFRQYFRNLTIRPRPGSVMPAKLVEVDTGYNIEFHDVHFDLNSTTASDIPDGGTVALALGTAAAIVANNVVIRGASNLSTQSTCYGIKVTGTSSVRISNADIEVFNRGIQVGSGGIVDVVGVYLERNIVGVENNGGAGTVVSLMGGKITVANNSCQPIRMSISGGTTNIISTTLLNELGTNLVYSWTGSKGLFIDPVTNRVRIGSGGLQANSPLYSIQLNNDSAQGVDYGLGIGEFVQCIGEAATYPDDFEFRYVGTGSKTARFFAPGAGTFGLMSDGPIQSQQRIVSGQSTLTYGTTVSVSDLGIANHFLLTPTDGVAFTISSPGGKVAGQCVTFTIKNTTGGALGAVTWGSFYKMASWVQPATGFSRSITFMCDGTNLIEVSRAAADIPN